MTVPNIPHASEALAQSTKNWALREQRLRLGDPSNKAVRECATAVFFAIEKGYSGIACGHSPLNESGKKIFTDKGYGVQRFEGEPGQRFGDDNYITLDGKVEVYF